MKKYALIGISNGNSWAIIYNSLTQAKEQYKQQKELNKEINDETEKVYLCGVLE